MEVERFLNSVYLSLAQPVEITLKDNSMADGFFGGLNIETGQILIRNYCVYNTLSMEKEKKLKLDEIKFFVVKKIKMQANRQRNKNKKKNSIKEKNQSNDKKSVNSSAMNKSGSKDKETRVNRKKAKTQFAKGENASEFQPLIVKGDNAFLTDKDISNNNANKRDRNTMKGPKGKQKVFHKWDMSSLGQGQSLGNMETLDDDIEEKFDQFELNKRINQQEVEEFNEDDYTTSLKHHKFSRKEIEEAKRLENEIIKGINLHNIETRHILEERNKAALCDNEDEEALYSAVIPTKVQFVPKNSTNKVSETADQGFLKSIFSHWNSKQRKGSDLLETLSRPSDNKSDNSGFNYNNAQQGGFVRNNIYNNSTGFNQMYNPVS